jgi:uncharacterized protein YjbI with pentapeptide repeats
MDVSDYPDFSSHGYQVTKELGCNQEGGRITYLATAQNLDHQVVIKEFRFALASANWSGFKAYQREIEMLQQLAHPRIPRYLDSFETKVGFCLVQEYKNALSLAVRRSFTAEQIKRIGVSVLKILVYLQQRTPPIIHRDIKPENILVDKQLNVYLVDFGFARIRGGELALSSVAAGTPGFMPPEEQFGRPLTEASDLYSLGATLICLLTGTRSVDIGTLIDDNYRFDFKKLVPKLNPRFISWLDKMVAPNVKQRYANAAVALEAMKSNQVVGGATGEISVDSIEGRVLAAVLGVAALGIVPGVGIILNSQQASPVKQLGERYPGSSLQASPVKQLGERYPGSSLQDSLVTQLRETKQCVGCHLVGVNLKGHSLRHANLTGANLTGANLTAANLENANLGNANLTGANLKGAHLKHADLQDAILKGAYVRAADLGNADLMAADLGNADLRGAKLTDAKLTGVDLENADLRAADLGNADLRSANLKGADLEGADLEGAIMPDGKKHP